MTETIEAGISQYSQWRLDLYQRIQHWREWLIDKNLYDAQSEMRISQILDALRDDRLYVAFVAEFSRGKSELINAIFFSNFGERVLPSSAGRTTMCPTEILYIHNTPPSIRLLPIETRATGTSVSEYKNMPEEWTEVAIDMSKPQRAAKALGAVTDTMQVSDDKARELGLNITDQNGHGLQPTANGVVDIPRWRHAVINIPHPMLERGLVILDTPGLNALGAEPELTLNLLASAHATLFILAADAGVTKSDIAVWKDHILENSPAEQANLIVLNKIDGLWDDLRSSDDIERDLKKQVKATARSLNVQSEQIYPVSAQKALLAKIRNNAGLLQKSRIEEIETALSTHLIPAKQDIVRDNIRDDIADLTNTAQITLQERIYSLEEHLSELQGLGGKNTGVIENMMGKISQEKQYFERSQQRFAVTRKAFVSLSNKLYAQLNLSNIDILAAQTKRDMSISATTHGMQSAMVKFFQTSLGAMESSAGDAHAIKKLMDTVYKEFSEEYGLKKLRPRSFSTAKYLREIKRLEASHEGMMRGLKLYMTGQIVLSNKFYDSAVSGVRDVFLKANRDADNWLRTMLSPMESQVREHQSMLRRRLESIKRIHQATDTLDIRVTELRETHAGTVENMSELELIVDEIQQHLGIGSA